MMMKYVFVTGGVVSGLGKGICAASLGRLLKQRGLRVQNQKFDPYLNVDPGTMSPYQHGEVFVTDDGAETDLDLGHYERFTDESLTVTVTTAGETNIFTFGAENAATGDIYLKKAGDDALYTVAASKTARFALSRAELFGAFNPAGLTRSAIESVTLTCGDEPFTLTAVSEAAESDRSADSESDSTAYTTVWRLADAPDAELDETQVSSLLSALSSYVTAQDPHGDASGMKQLAAATVRAADGERTLTYYEGTDGYYLTVSGDASLYTVDADTVQTVCTAKDRYKAAS